MSSALPVLQKLRKSDLTELAEASNLQGYSSLKKADLEEKLDKHLQKNQTTYATVPSFQEYYQRLGTQVRSPVKKIAEKVSDIIKSDDETSPVAAAQAVVKKARRKTKSPEDLTDTDGATATTSSALVKTPGKELSRRASILASNIPLPPSPAVVTDAIENQSRKLRNSISHAYNRTQIHEYSDAARELLSSTVTVNLFAIALEAFYLLSVIVPNKLFYTVPSVNYIKSTKTPVKLPDMFVLLTQNFWAPFSLWLLTTIIAPAFVSYFINLPLKQLPSHGHLTRKASVRAAPHTQFDPFVFNIAKGLIAYLVLGLHVPLVGLYQHFTAAAVNECLPGGYQGVLVSSGIGAAVSLYEAVLKK